MIEEIISELSNYIKDVEKTIEKEETKKHEKKIGNIQTFYQTSDGKSFVNVRDAENHQANINNKMQDNLTEILDKIHKETFGKIEDFDFQVLRDKDTVVYSLDVVVGK